MKNAQSSWTPHSVHAPADNDNADDDDLDLRALGDNCVSVREWTHAAQLICDDRVVMRCCEGWMVMLAVNGCAGTLKLST